MSENGQVMVLAGLLQQAAETFKNMMQDVPAEVAHAAPAGNANSIAANAAHSVTAIDGIVHGIIKGEMPLFASEATGLSQPAPTGGDWGDWGKTVTIDKATFEAYAGKVMQSVGQHLGSMSNGDLEKTAVSPSGFEMSVGRWLGIAILNTAWHTGEVAALKGLHGLKGYPF